MEWIGTHRDIPEERRDAVLSQLFRIGFRPAYGRQKTVKREMEKSRPCWPSIFFVSGGGTDRISLS